MGKPECASGKMTRSNSTAGPVWGDLLQSGTTHSFSSVPMNTFPRNPVNSLLCRATPLGNTIRRSKIKGPVTHLAQVIFRGPPQLLVNPPSEVGGLSFSPTAYRTDLSPNIPRGLGSSGCHPNSLLLDTHHTASPELCTGDR